MISVKTQPGLITIEGHAGYAETGKDIVCAGVSALAQTLVGSIEALTEDTISFEMVPGSMRITYKDLSPASRLLVDSFFIGIGMIAEEFPEHVRNDGNL